MKNFAIVLVLVGSLLFSGCAAALLLGAGGAAGYLFSENQELKKGEKNER